MPFLKNSMQKELVIVFWALFLNICFLIRFHGHINDHGSYYPETPRDLAYSVYKDNSFLHYMAKTFYKDGIQISSVIEPIKIPIFEGPAYGWLMGLLWKLTGSLRYYDMQVLQMFLFAFSCLLLYWSMLFVVEKRAAFFSALAVPLFFPLMFLNINPVRDVFCFYGATVLVYLVMQAFYGKSRLLVNVGGGFFIAVCQWMRQTVFSALGAVSVFLFLYVFLFERKKISATCTLLIILWGTNIAGFWIPWMAFNKQVFGRYLVGQSGQLLLDSMGYTGPNKINPKCPDTNNGLYCDACVTQYTIKRFDLDTSQVRVGTLEMDDKMKEAFWEWFWQDPAFWFKGLFWRIKKVLFLDLTWSTTHGLSWQHYNSFSNYTDRLKAAYVSYGFYGLLEFLFRRWYVRCLMILGYAGAALLVKQKKFLFLGVLLSICIGGIIPAIISHPEHRYLTPFYFVYPLLGGYFLYILGNYLYRKQFSKCIKMLANFEK